MKIVLKMIIALLLVGVVVVVGAYFYVDAIAKKAVERGGEMALGVPTNLDDIHISLWGGEAELSGLRISNPPGFSAPTFLDLGAGDIAVSLKSLLDNTVRIPRIRMSGIRINLEQADNKNNIEPLLARAKSMSGQAGEKAPQPAGGGEKKFIVEYFTLDDVQLNADLNLFGQTSKVNLVLPKIELRNLGAAEQGLPMAELVQQVVQVVLNTARASSVQLSPELAKLLAGELGGLDTIRGEVVGKARAQVEKAVSELQEKLPAQLPAGSEKLLEEKTGDLLKGVGDLLGGKKE